MGIRLLCRWLRISIVGRCRGRVWWEPGEGAQEIVAAGDRTVVRWTYLFGHGHVRGVDVLRVRDGRVAEKLSYVKG
jgi:hypothetical protein